MKTQSLEEITINPLVPLRLCGTLFLPSVMRANDYIAECQKRHYKLRIND